MYVHNINRSERRTVCNDIIRRHARVLFVLLPVAVAEEVMLASQTAVVYVCGASQPRRVRAASPHPPVHLALAETGQARVRNDAGWMAGWPPSLYLCGGGVVPAQTACVCLRYTAHARAYQCEIGKGAGRARARFIRVPHAHASIWRFA